MSDLDCPPTVSRNRNTAILTFFGQFIDHDITLSHQNLTERNNITILSDPDN